MTKTRFLLQTTENEHCWCLGKAFVDGSRKTDIELRKEHPELNWIISESCRMSCVCVLFYLKIWRERARFFSEKKLKQFTRKRGSLFHVLLFIVASVNLHSILDNSIPFDSTGFWGHWWPQTWSRLKSLDFQRRTYWNEAFAQTGSKTPKIRMNTVTIGTFSTSMDRNLIRTLKTTGIV